ncbi:YajG family lipoprotein [Vibrio sp. JC009]|uniref:YajG family lipoprotein n=1 Tax=Vibrio sp. JC009 TaxID=2912314 RepID=UPI0023B03A9C|nr:YajG family lipoprotein [Vibrio sp. JC009]WED22448.1 YajG family lipoprotein [Vibrio sp. JC009]
MKKIIIAASLAFLAACSSSPQQTQISFNPKTTTSQNRVVDNKTFTLTSRDIRSAQYVALIDTGRSNIEPVHAQQNVRITLETALQEQFRSQGYYISVNSQNTVELEVQELLVNVRHSVMANEMDAKVTIKLTAETPAGKLVKTYNGTAAKSGAFSASDAQIEMVINDITSLVLEDIANDQELTNYMKERF